MPEQRTSKASSILVNIDTNTLPSSRNRRKNKGRRRRSSLSIESYDDELYEKLPSLGEKREKSTRRSIVMDEDSEDEGEQYLPPLKITHLNDVVHDATNHDDLMKEKVVQINDENKNLNDSSKKKNRKSLTKQLRKRRRSSARFLRLSGRFGEDSTDELTQLRNNADQEKLGDMYRQAIRMNAENKINAANSWGLNFIQNMDKFLGDEGDDDDDDRFASQSTRTKSMTPTSTKKYNAVNDKNIKSKNIEKRVNFTKASCTLDASVKIYSYRVDDVHLSSYKVLANLNRTENGKKGKDSSDFQDEVPNGDDINGNAIQLNKRKNAQARSGATLERNPVNININKLDSAYDIDPLFHQMSQKFDEGGAKGLLLVNLGVASDGCRVVLDSKEDSQVPSISKSLLDIQPQFVEEDDGNNNESMVDEDYKGQTDSDPTQHIGEEIVKGEGEIDISCLCDKLQEMLHSNPLDTLQFVPQLEDLRSEYRTLEDEGFVDNKMQDSLLRRFKIASEEEEKEAEEYIHREVMERTGGSILNNSMAMNMSFGLNTSIAMNMSFGLHTLSQGIHNASMIMEPIEDNEQSFGEEDFGGGNEEFGENDDVGFGNFLDSEGSDPLNNEFSSQELISASQHSGTKKSSTTLFLDALCSSDAFVGAGDSEFFNVSALNKITKGNLWAGSAHWKKAGRKKKKTTEESAEDTMQKRKRSNEKRSHIDFSSSNSKDLKALLETNCTSEEKSKSLLISNTTRQKQNKELNLLPPDAGIELDLLSRLFLRPKARLLPTSEDTLNEGKRVGFVGFETYTDGDEDFGEENFDDGQGFALSNNDNFTEKDDYVVGELAGVRKVDKVIVDHATVAKTVDVRKLKKDLWAEVEQQTNSEGEEKLEDDPRSKKDSIESNASECDISDTEKQISFNDTVQKLDPEQSQNGVTVSFYFICMLHLANEKCLKLKTCDDTLSDFMISNDHGFDLFNDMVSNITIADERKKRERKVKTWKGNNKEDNSMESDLHIE